MQTFPLEKGQTLFVQHCNICHKNQENIILPEKSLQKDKLKQFGMNKKEALLYEIKNGKNGMPAFEFRLSNLDIDSIVKYLIDEEKMLN